MCKKIHDGHGIINIGFLRTLGAVTVPTLCRQFLEENPKRSIDYNLDAGNSYELISGLKTGQYDLIITSELEYNHNIEFIPFGEHELLLIVSKNHELAKYKSVSIEEIVNFDFIAYKNNTELHRVITPNFERINKFPFIKFVAEEEPIIAGLVAQNFGIAIVPDTPILDSLDIVKIKINDMKQNRLYYIAHLKNKLQPPLISDFIDYASTHNFSKYIKFY
ncbi:hypothetical protein IR059_04620 [Gemella sp. GL1.1]|nr:hypothetical protein [Gemella sp. GL1.1]NYS27834.1 hypothetical protein [Gemella sp. GL1]